MSEELELFRENVKRFVETEVTPDYEQWEKDEIFPRELWNKLGEQGLLAVSMEDPRLTWPERELVRQLGNRLYGKRHSGRV